MSYGDLIYKLGKRYSKEREQHPEEEFVYFSGQLSDLLDETALQSLPELEGEHVIAYRGSDGANHFIRVYFDDHTFEAEGTPGDSTAFNVSVDVDREVGGSD